MSLPTEVVAQMADDPAYPRPHKPKPGRPRGRPPGSKPRKGGQAKRAFLNAALFVSQSGERVPVIRLLVTLPEATAARADELAKRLGTSVSGLLCCLLDELPDPKSIMPAPNFTPPEPNGGVGIWKPLWMPTNLGGKLARHLMRVGWTHHQFFSHMLQVLPDSDLMAKPHKAFAGWEEPSPPSPG